MVQFPSAAAGPRAGGHVEPPVHRARALQAKRPKLNPTPGDHHSAVPGNGTNHGKDMKTKKERKKRKDLFLREIALFYTNFHYKFPFCEANSRVIILQNQGPIR